jgi:hypothetical protein
MNFELTYQCNTSLKMKMHNILTQFPSVCPLDKWFNYISLFETFLVTQSTIWRKEKVIAYIKKYKIFVFYELQFFVEFLFLKDEIVLRSLSSSSTW